VAVSALRGEEAAGHLGLWPEAALINHSCTPNATGERGVGGVGRCRAHLLPTHALCDQWVGRGWGGEVQGSPTHAPW